MESAGESNRTKASKMLISPTYCFPNERFKYEYTLLHCHLPHRHNHRRHHLSKHHSSILLSYHCGESRWRAIKKKKRGSNSKPSSVIQHLLSFAFRMFFEVHTGSVLCNVIFKSDALTEAKKLSLWCSRCRRWRTAWVTSDAWHGICSLDSANENESNGYNGGNRFILHITKMHVALCYKNKMIFTGIPWIQWKGSAFPMIVCV